MNVVCQLYSTGAAHSASITSTNVLQTIHDEPNDKKVGENIEQLLW